MLQLYFYVPENNLNTVLDTIFAAGAGKYQNYDRCCWVTKGRGQFRPLDGSKPAIGAHHKLEHVDEYKVEIMVNPKNKDDVLQALVTSHPYEEVAYGFLEIIL